MGLVRRAAPPSSRLGQGRRKRWRVVNRRGWDGLLDAHRHIIFLPGDLFHRGEIHSSNRAYFITVQGHNSDVRMHTQARLRWTDAAVLFDPPLSDVTVCVKSAGNDRHLLLVSECGSHGSGRYLQT